MNNAEREWWSVVPASVLADALKRTSWRAATGKVASAPYLLLLREPLPAASDTHGHSIRFSILWTYGDKGSYPPSIEEALRMERFEQHLCAAVERDDLSFLMAVLTSGGTRQWVFYTSDGYACGTRIARIAREAQPYPIEMVAENDPEWSFIRSGVFGN